MDNTQATLLASIIGVTGTLAGAAMQAYGRDLLDFFHIGTLKLPYLKGEWDATWYVEEFGVERIYTIDMVQISRQHKIIFLFVIYGYIKSLFAGLNRMFLL